MSDTLSAVFALLVVLVLFFFVLSAPDFFSAERGRTLLYPLRLDGVTVKEGNLCAVVTNPNSVDVNVSSVLVVVEGKYFDVLSSDCGETLPPNRTCTLCTGFTPEQGREYSVSVRMK